MKLVAGSMHFYYGTFPFANEKGATTVLQKIRIKSGCKEERKKEKGQVRWGNPDSSRCVLNGRDGICGDKDRKGHRSE